MKKVAILFVLLLFLIPTSVNAFSVSQITSHKDVCLSDNDFDFSLYVRQETGKTQYMMYEHEDNQEIFILPTDTSKKVTERIEIPNEEGIHTNYFLFSFYGGYIELNGTLTSSEILNTNVKDFDVLGFAYPLDYEMKDINSNVTLTEISNKYDTIENKAMDKYDNDTLNAVLVDDESEYKFKFYDIGGHNPRIYFNIHYNETNEPIHIWAYNSDEIHSARYGATSRTNTRIKSKLELNVTDCSTPNQDEENKEESEEEDTSSGSSGGSGSIDYDDEEETNEIETDNATNETDENVTDVTNVTEEETNETIIENKTFTVNTTDNTTEETTEPKSNLMWRFWVVIGGFVVFIIVCIFMIARNEKRVSI